MKDKDIINLYNNTNDKYSNILFNKDYNLLQIGEIQKVDEYIKDCNNPIWKDIYVDGKKTGYMISNVGEVKGIRGNILKKDISNTGYFSINAYFKKPFKIRIHREVCKLFNENIDNKPFVNHINGNKQCNWYKNLEWVTHKENMDHAIKNGLINIKGVNHPENKYSEETIKRVCELLEENKIKLIDIEKLTGVTRNTLYSIRTGKSWTHISNNYKIDKPITQKDFEYDCLEEACKLLQDTKNSYSSITRKTKIPYRTLIKIVDESKSYREISRKYKIRELRK